MTMKRACRVLITLVVTWLVAGSAFAQTQSGDTWRWTGKLNPDQLLQIKNVNGAIEADGSSGDTIEVVAEKSGEDRDQVRVEMVNGPDGVTICAVYPGEGNSCTAGSDYHQRVHDVHAKVDFTVKLPRNLRFDARNVNGSVRAEGLGRVVHATTVNGGVTVSTDSWAEASSVNGSVTVRMGSADWQGTLKISSVNGSINLDVPSNLNTEVRFHSVNGSLDTDLPLTISHTSGRWGPKSIEGTIGSGGRELDVNTVNGSVRIRSQRASL
jgi:DUF4097 and DUF4098 domain-containing protein YvlB